ncbi:MAG: hypothetical protein ACPG7F_19875 [Aggregatilineales bacterium]
MKRKHFLSMLAILALTILSVAAVSAQGRGGNGQGRGAQWIELTGLDAESLQAARDAGQTLAEAITANGGDVTAVETALIEQFSQRPNADADAVAERVDTMLNTPLDEVRENAGDRDGRRGNLSEAFNIITDATGLDAAALREAAASGQTLADIITANGGDVSSVEASLVALFSENSDLDADAIAERVNDFLNTVREGRPNNAPALEGTDL